MKQEEKTIMILNFKTKNFKSIKDLIELDFLANKKQKDHIDTLIEAGNEKILPIISIYGANASGKSNVIKALTSMIRVIVGDKKNGIMPYISPFAYNEKSMKEPTFFEIEFFEQFSNTIYRYGFECDKKNIYEEWLYTSIINDRDNEEEFFYRNVKDDVFKISDKLRGELYKEINEAHSMVKDNELIMYIINKRLEESVDKKIEIKDEQLKHLLLSLFNLCTISEFTPSAVDEIDFFMLKSAENEMVDKEVLNYATNLIQEIDPSIIRLEHDTSMDENLNEINNLYTIRITEQQTECRLPASIESSGTKKMLYLATHLSFALETGGYFLYDELDLKFHPLLFRKIVRMFNDKEINRFNAQLIFTSHNLICLDSGDLRRDSVYFTEKNDNNTEVYSLADIKVNGELVRSDLDFGKHYLAGRFGGIPFRDEG